MTNVILAEPSFFGGLELLLIAAVLMFFLVPFAIGLVVFLILRSRSQRKAVAPTAPDAPPVIETQRLSRTCPKCGAELKADVPEGLCPSCLLKQGIATEGAEPAGQTPFIPPTVAELARLFPQLEILEPIGKGGMGAVYKARQPALDRFVALKILAPRPGGDLDFESRFSREARALARLSHPNIVAVYDFGQVQRPSSAPPAAAPAVTAPPQPLNYFLMEFVDGPNLRQIEQAGKLSPREALQIIPQICVALQFAHDEGIVHRDIKPENVLLDKRGRVKIADFGLAKILGQEQQDLRLTGAKDVMGTPHYMAPEQVETPQEVDHRADIYSLGVVFYEMLTGELPLGKFQPPSNKVSIDVRLDDVVLRALAKEPERRYQQASALKTEIDTIAGTPGAVSSGTGAGAAIQAGPPLPSARLSRVAIVGVCWAALFFVIGLLWFIPSQVQPNEFGPTPRSLRLLTLPFLALAVSAPFGTTLLGWIAVAHIRRGAGKLYGLGLAVFDGLCFPLLLLDAVIGVAVLFVVRVLGMHDSPFPIFARGPVWTIFAPLYFVLIAMVDFLIVHLTWRAVKRSMGAALPAPPSAGSGKRPALWIGAGLAIPVAILIGLVWVNTRRSIQSSYNWHPASLDGSIEATTGAATLRVTEVSQQGQVVVLTILSEPGFAPQEFVVSFPGPAMDSPFASTEFTNVDCLIAPTRNGFGQAAFGELLAGTNVLRGPGQLRIGFVFPDEAAASIASMQVDQVHVGKPRGLEWDQTLCLFALSRRSGTDSRGRAVIELLNGEIAVRQVPAVAADPWSRTRAPGETPVPWTAPDAAGRKPATVEAENPTPPVPGATGLEFHWVAADSDTNSPTVELPHADDSSARPKLRLLTEPVLGDDAVIGAALYNHEERGSREIVLMLTEPASARLAEISAKNIGRQLAIVWDGRVLSALVIRDVLKGPYLTLNGDFSDRDCNRLLYALNHRNPTGLPETEIDANRLRQLQLLLADEAQLTKMLTTEGYKPDSSAAQLAQRQIDELARQLELGAVWEADSNRRRQLQLLHFLETKQFNMIIKDRYKEESDPVRLVQQQIDELKRQLTNAPAASTNELAGNLNARLDAARAILAFPERDKALAAVAVDAARAGNSAIAKRALSQITAFNSRDAAAREATRALAKNGHRTEALEIARTITSFVERDAALQELAK